MLKRFPNYPLPAVKAKIISFLCRFRRKNPDRPLSQETGTTRHHPATPASGYPPCPLILATERGPTSPNQPEAPPCLAVSRSVRQGSQAKTGTVQGPLTMGPVHRRQRGLCTPHPIQPASRERGRSQLSRGSCNGPQTANRRGRRGGRLQAGRLG